MTKTLHGRQVTLMLAENQQTAHNELLTPPKSTFVTPKLRTGFVVRPTAPLRWLVPESAL